MSFGLFLLSSRDDFIGEIEAVLGEDQDRHAVEAEARSIHDEVVVFRLHLLEDQLGDLIDDAIAHADSLLLKLLLAGLGGIR